MGDMADFYGWGAVDYDPIEELMCLKDKDIIKKATALTIPITYEYRELCKNILDYYRANKKLSKRQKLTLCLLIHNFGGI